MTRKINIPEKYNHLIEEKKWQDYWEQLQVYAWDATLLRSENFVIDTPPPTVSGHLHMGHVFSYTQTDFVARYMRMKGLNVFYPMGFDDNGLPTERLVEKERNVRAVNMDRDQFIAICQEVVNDAELIYKELFKTIALSVDWTQEYQTISKKSRAISQASFLDLFKKNEVYRAAEPNLFDPIDQTALAQADVVDLPQNSAMNNIAFKTASGEELVIATTRPELLPACQAVFFHPDDARYQHLVGKQAVTPLFGKIVPLIASSEVEIEKGTGLVMCCTFGDITDIKWWREHKLPLKIIISKVGRICNIENMNYAEIFTGLKVKEARVKMIDLLTQENLLLGQTELINNVKCAERSGGPLEILVSNQWLVKVLDKKEALLKRSTECNWYPAYMQKRLDMWINALNWDWCISRQRFFGVPFPVWYSKRVGEEGKILVAEFADLPVDPLKDLPKGYTRDEVEADMDVMDTWATSSISPQLSSHAINQEHAFDLGRHQKLFPADLRPQAHEIIRTWAFYTIVKAHLHQSEIPWKNVMISGWCLSADKSKMSKSKGNIVTPIALLEEKGSDVVRYWASTSKLGADTAYSEDVLKIGKKLVNKIWNAAKFAAIHLEVLTTAPEVAVTLYQNGEVAEVIDLWILSKLHKTIVKATAEFEKFEYCNARVAIEDFFWNDLCDNYLEIVKMRVYDEQGVNQSGKLSAVKTIYHILETILKLFAPFCPHITEELYSHIFVNFQLAKNGSIHSKNNWPDAANYPYLEVAQQTGVDLVNILNIVRKVKAEQNISLKAPVTKLWISKKYQCDNLLATCQGDLQNVTNSLEIIMDSADVAEHEWLTSDDGRYLVAVQLGV